MSSEDIQEIQEIHEIPQEIPEIQENKNEDCRDVAPVVPKRGRGRPKGAKNKVTLLTVDTDIPSVSLNEEPVTLHEEPAAPASTKKPRKKRVQPPPDPTPERHVPEHVESGATTHPMARMMMTLHELQRERMEARKTMFRNMIA